MQIAMLDLMPLLWGLCILLSAALHFYGDHAAPARTIPAAACALLLHFFEKPPRMQVIAFGALYVLCAAVYTVLCRLYQRKTDTKTAAEPPAFDASNGKIKKIQKNS